jgi:aldose sugar dehydrogenase
MKPFIAYNTLKSLNIVAAPVVLIAWPKFTKFILLMVTTFSLLLAPSSADDELASAGAEKVLTDPNLEIEVLAEGLISPTAMAFLGQDDILVLTKQGKINRIVNGNLLADPLLELEVDSQGERGLLGIAVANQPEEGNEEGRQVFLYYTEKELRPDDDCQGEGCKINEYFFNRLYKYELKGDELINRQKFIEIPLGSELLEGIMEVDHNGGALTIGPDNNVYFLMGDAGSCFGGDSCQRATEDGFLAAQTANKINGTEPIGKGGILRFTQNGEPIDNILGDEYPLNLYYAYGIRNGFGIDFDPVTGNLWDAENGPIFGDEINLVEPGFNSGWAKIQGEWIIHNSEQLKAFDQEKGYYPSSTNNDDPELVDFGGNGQYSPPEFVWNKTVGLTSLKFFDSDALGEEYENDMFVGGFNYGLLFHFDLDEERRNFVLQEPLTDKVADNDDETNGIIFGSGFGSITDIEVGPDGDLYLLTFAGELLKVVSKDKGD